MKYKRNIIVKSRPASKSLVHFYTQYNKRKGDTIYSKNILLPVKCIIVC